MATGSSRAALVASVLDRLRPHPHRGDIIAAGAVPLALAAFVIELRMTHWALGPRFIVAFLIAALLLTMAWLAPLEGGSPRAYHSVQLVKAGGIASLLLGLDLITGLVLAGVMRASGALLAFTGMPQAGFGWKLFPARRRVRAGRLCRGRPRARAGVRRRGRARRVCVDDRVPGVWGWLARRLAALPPRDRGGGSGDRPAAAPATATTTAGIHTEHF
jgi:hypothetical protein